jgi:Icc-related predicted phosphoesterase
MKICAISDTHGYHRDLEIKECDILCIAGDISPLNIQGRKQAFLSWLQNDFIPWCEELPVKKVFLTPGNHELALSHCEDTVRKFLEKTKITILINELFEYEDFKIWGTPLSNKFGNWAYMKSPEEELEQFMQMPKDLDILIVHGPPYGACDICKQHPYNNYNHLGNPELTIVSELKTPKIILCGHLHTGETHEKLFDNIDVFNVSVLNEEYKIFREPLYLEIEKEPCYIIKFTINN